MTGNWSRGARGETAAQLITVWENPAQARTVVAQSRYEWGIGDVLQHLVGMDDIERVVGEFEVVHVSGRECDVRQVVSLNLCAGHVEDVAGLVDGKHRPGRDPLGEVRGDRPGTASDVQHGQPRLQVGQQVGRGVLRGASLVAAQHRFVMSVRVLRRAFVAHGPKLTGSFHIMKWSSHDTRQD